MAKILDDADEATVALAYDVMRERHAPLAEAGVTLYVLTVSGLKLHGYPAMATIKVNGPEERLKCGKDATLKLDEDFALLSAPKKRGTLDHELEHLDLLLETRGEHAGKPKRDDKGRPRLRCRKHDLVVGGFRAVIERNGEDALEVGHIHYCGRAAAECLERAPDHAPAPAGGIAAGMTGTADEVVAAIGERFGRPSAVTLSSGHTSVTFKAEDTSHIQAAAEALRGADQP